jgi:acyl transferase domain-containing protein/acyl carrier protein
LEFVLSLSDAVVGLFPGQGAYRPGLLRQQWLEGDADVAEVFGTLDGVSQRRLGRTVTSVIFAEVPPPLDFLLREHPDVLQLAILGVSTVGFRRLTAGGATVSVLLGHSLGEISALVSAGVWSVEDGASIICDRIEVLGELAPAGGLLAVACSADRVTRLLGVIEDAGLVLAVDNSAAQCVVSGSVASLEKVRAVAAALGIGATTLAGPYGFHHPDLAAAARAFTSRVSAYSAKAPAAKVYSPILGRCYRDRDDFANLVGTHLVHPVDFRAAIARVWDDGARIFAEVGAGGALTGLVARACPLAVTYGVFDELPAPVTPTAPAATPVVDRVPAQRVPVVPPVVVPESGTGRTEVGRTEVLGQLRDLYAQELDYPVEVLEESASLEGTLGVDSMRQTELLAKTRALFNLGVPPAGFRTAEYTNLGKIADYVVDLLPASTVGADHAD